MNKILSFGSIEGSPTPSKRSQMCGSLAPTKPLDSEFDLNYKQHSSPLVSDWTTEITTSSPIPSKDAEREYIFENSPYKAKRSKVFELDSIKRILSFDDNIHQEETNIKIDLDYTRKNKAPSQSVKLQKLR